MKSKLIIFGGSGYVGRNIIKKAKQLGVEIVSVSRSAGSGVSDASIEGVTWVKGDILSEKNDAWAKHLEGAQGAISCVGAFGTNEYMEKANGDATINAVSACLRSGVKRFTFISTVDNNLPDFVLKGYELLLRSFVDIKGFFTICPLISPIIVTDILMERDAQRQQYSMLT